MKIFVLAFFILLTGCVTVAKFEKRMDAKKGFTKEQLIDEMGIPVREYKSDNFEIVEYYQSAKGYIPKTSTSNIIGNIVYTTTSGGAYEMDCKLEFKLVNGIVTNYRYQGQLCRSE